MRFMILVKATKDTEAGLRARERTAEIEVRQLFELDDFQPSKAIERFREMKVGTKQ